VTIGDLWYWFKDRALLPSGFHHINQGLGNPGNQVVGWLNFVWWRIVTAVHQLTYDNIYIYIYIYQVTCTEQKAPRNGEVHMSFHNVGYWVSKFPRITWRLELGSGIWFSEKFVDPWSSCLMSLSASDGQSWRPQITDRDCDRPNVLPGHSCRNVTDRPGAKWNGV
jgi:hypothetical protein